MCGRRGWHGGRWGGRGREEEEQEEGRRGKRRTWLVCIMRGGDCCINVQGGGRLW